MFTTKDISVLKTLINESLDSKFDEFEVKVDKKFDDFEVKVDKKFDELDLKVDKKLKPIHKKLDKLQKDFDVAIKSSDRDHLKNRRRIENIEDHLGLSNPNLF